MLMVPVLEPPVLTAIDIVTFLLPVPLEEDKLTQSRLFDVVQEQFEPDAEIETVLLPALEEKLPLVGEML
jgi:hypothetical protein